MTVVYGTQSQQETFYTTCNFLRNMSLRQEGQVWKDWESRWKLVFDIIVSLNVQYWKDNDHEIHKHYTYPCWTVNWDKLWSYNCCTYVYSWKSSVHSDAISVVAFLDIRGQFHFSQAHPFKLLCPTHYLYIHIDNNNMMIYEILSNSDC